MDIRKITYITCIFLGLGLWSCTKTQTEESTAEAKATDSQEMAEDHGQKMTGKHIKTDTTGMREPLKSYMVLKDALVDSDPSAVVNAAAVLANVLEGESKDMALKTVQTNDLKEQRALFQGISVGMYEMLKAKEGLAQDVYKQYCPMAFNNEGAYWLSGDEVIMNPYFGDKMLKCGKVEETLAAAN